MQHLKGGHNLPDKTRLRLQLPFVMVRHNPQVNPPFVNARYDYDVSGNICP